MSLKFFDSISPKNVFLVDGLGALLTAGGIYALATFFLEWVGMPYDILQTLALVALCMAAYSLACHFFLRGKRQSWLAVIIIANLTYILVTAILLWIYRDRIKWPGLIYFFSEFVVVLVLVRWEAKIRLQSV